MAVCSMKKLTTTMIHLLITSNQSENDSCEKVLNGVFDCFHSNKKHFTLDDIKYFIQKTKEEKYDIASSYEYIGLKIMHILRLFIKGERFPEGKLTKDKHVLYLTQSISFITENEKAFELIQVNARSFFTVITEIYLNKQVSNMIIELNNNKDESGNPEFVVTHQIVTDRLLDIVDALQSIDYIKFEYYYFIIKIANAEYYKSNPQRLVTKVFDAIAYILSETYAYLEKKKSMHFKQPLSQKYIGPNDINLADLEQQILDILPIYTTFMEAEQLYKIIECSKELKIDRLRIHIYEEQKDFEECIHTYLRSEGCKTEDVFPWLKMLQRKQNTLDEDSIERIQNEILKVIDELVMADSIKTSEVIDTWLPNQHLEIIDKLGNNKDLQLKYLKDFVNEREDEIKEAMLTAGKRNKTRDEINDYKYFLKLHVKLLASRESSELKNVVMKEYYPVDCLDDIKDNSTNFKEAQAYLCKRTGDIEKSLSIFLDLIEEIGYDEIKNDSLYQDYGDSSSNLSFSKIFAEICDMLIKWTSIPGYKNEIWFTTLKTLFSIKNKFYVGTDKSKSKSVDKIIFNKISDYLQLMSKYCEFEQVIKILLESDNSATFRYSKDWFKNLFISKSDQEFLYRSAKVLLRNENSTMIDVIIENFQTGFKGNSYQT